MTIVDTSYWQNFISQSTFAAWKAAGVTRVVHKAGGLDDGAYKDSRHDSNVAACRSVGLGVDHYLFNGPASADGAASAFVSWANAQSGDKMWLDIEGDRWSAAMALQVAQATKAKNGLLPGDYMSSSVIRADNWQPNVNAGQELWVAQYGPNDGQPHSVPAVSPWAAYTYWQYTSQGRLPGYGGPLDLSLGDGVGGIVIGMPASSTGYNASTWSTATIQAALVALGFDTGGIDGDYGPKTTQAVHDFEVKYGLGVDVGIAGPEVVGKLAQLTNISTQSATRVGLIVDGIEGHLTTASEQRALQRHGISVGASGDDGIRGRDTIYAEQTLTGAGKDGVDGPDTTTHLQNYLIGLGYSVGPTGADGIRGANTIKGLQSALNDGRF